EATPLFRRHPQKPNRIIFVLNEWFLRGQSLQSHMLETGFIAIDSAEPYHRRFSLQDATIQFPYAEKDTVPMWAAALIAVLLPFLIITAVSLVIKKSMHDWHHATLGLILGLSLTLLVTEVFKTTVGRPRPDFIDRCQPKNGSVDSPVFGLSTSAICTQTNQGILKDGFKSFISGHASTTNDMHISKPIDVASFSGLGFLSLYLAGKLHVWDQKGHTYKGFLVVAPLVVATLVAISRTTDYRHHWQDVVTGGLIGFLLSVFSYHQYYPALHSHISHKPYSVRLKKGEPDYRVDFALHDGTTFEVSVVRHDGTFLHQVNGKPVQSSEDDQNIV
ncbi:12504_t:CDS:2, partial [Acaulospora morrowiae]